ncbi:hypothetical protein AAU61_13140 [Desulfocarbo indianensis]|nr:hypothetical protein AAU61_13140 [Desulfocarbo indianensis]
MAEKPALSWNPLSFINSQGKYLVIPLSALYFDDAGQLKAERWPLYAANQADADLFLARLAHSGVLQAGPEPPAKPAFKATAVTAGFSGVTVEIQLANATPDADTPPDSAVDATVKETDAYAALALADMAAVLGSAPGGGARSGLVYLEAGDPPATPVAGTYQLASADPAEPARAEIPRQGGGDPAFVLVARAVHQDGALTEAKIGEVAADGLSCDLTVTWSKTAAGAAVSDLASAFAYVVLIEPPEGGYRAPAEGAIVLAGGSDALSVAARRASATVLAAQ